MTQNKQGNNHKLTGAEILWESLIEEGVDTIFGYPGGYTLPIYGVLDKYSDKVRHVLVRHEQGAVHMADGYARASGKVGVAIATSGPGATNMITGIATAMMDSIPLVCITGQVAIGAIGSDAFQETDIMGAVMPVTKHSYQVTDVKNLAHIFKEAFYIARSGRPGPVLIDIPKDVQNATYDYVYPEEPCSLPGYEPIMLPNSDQIQKAVDLINNAKQPVILAGHGVMLSGASNLVIELAEKADIPIGVTLLGIGGVPASHPLNIGFMGMHGGYGVNHAIQQADLLIACGMRFDDRVTGTLETYSPGSKKIHIEIDPTEINKNVTVDVGIVADLAEALKQINPNVQPDKKKDWLTRIDNWRKESHSRDILNKKSEDLIGAQVIRQIWRQTNGAALVVSDVGQNQMLEAQYYSHDEPNTLITSGGLGTMGFGLPAAIGASFAGRNKEIWVIVGDGGIQMTITELATLVQEKKKINIAILNNGYLGMVRQWQQLFYDARYTETPITGPDFMKIAEAYGVKGFRVTKTKDLEKTIQAAQDETGPCLIEFMIEKMGMVYPMVPAGAGLHDMVKRPTEDQFSKMDI